MLKDLLYYRYDILEGFHKRINIDNIRDISGLDERGRNTLCGLQMMISFPNFSIILAPKILIFLIIQPVLEKSSHPVSRS